MSDITVNQRAQQVLKNLIERYIQEGAPIGSKTLSEECALGMSPATIRHILADLESAGYITSPHTSAGRVPTQLGYRLFVNSLLKTQSLEIAKLDALKNQLDPDLAMPNLLQSASTLLSSLTKLVGVVALPRLNRIELRQVEFLALSANRVLVIIVLNNREVQNRIIYTDRIYTDSELQQAANYLNTNYAGKDLLSIRKALLAGIREDRETMARLLQTALEVVQHVNPKIAAWVESLKNAMIPISDIEDELRRYLDGLDLDPERLQWLETRIGLIFDLARKYKVGPQELSDLQQKIADELNTLQTSDARLAELHSKLDILESRYHDTAKKLSQSREEAANQLTIEIIKIIHELSLPNAEFKILFEYEKTPSISLHGLEKIIFQIKTNAGHHLQPLAKIASGGELSRISLAIHMATALQHTTPALIFDEVDVGVGGGTAEIIGKLLRRLGESHQVLCITHQAQVAAQGHQHILVTKIEKNNTTQSHIKSLSANEKISEIARMLGGVEITKKTIAHAREMVERVSEMYTSH